MEGPFFLNNLWIILFFYYFAQYQQFIHKKWINFLLFMGSYPQVIIVFSVIIVDKYIDIFVSIGFFTLQRGMNQMEERGKCDGQHANDLAENQGISTGRIG